MSTNVSLEPPPGERRVHAARMPLITMNLSPDVAITVDVAALVPPRRGSRILTVEERALEYVHDLLTQRWLLDGGYVSPPPEA